MQDNRTYKSCRQIQLCAFEKMTATINKIEKIIAMIIIKLLKH